MYGEITNILFITLLFILSIYTIYIFVSKKRPKSTPPYSNSHFISVNKLHIHYQVWGQGPPVVCVHGIAAATHSWSFLAELLQDQYTVYALDLPGFGYSEKKTSYSHNIDDQSETLHLFIKKLKLTQPLIIGSSMGGAISLYLSMRYTKEYPKVVAISPATNPKHAKNIRLKYFSIFLSKLYLVLNIFLIKKILSRVVNRKDLINDERANLYLRPYKEETEAVDCFILAFDHLISDSRLPNIFNGIKTDLLLLWGEKDKVTPLSFSEELVKLIPNCKLSVLKNGSHHLMEDDPDWCAKKITNFID